MMSINVFENDDTLNCPLVSITDISGPENGTIINAGNGLFIYEPTAGYCGLDSFTYILCTISGCDTAQVNIVVTCIAPCSIAPIANDDAEVTAQNMPVVVNVLTNDDTINCTVDTIYIIGNPTNGAVITTVTEGVFVYTPNLDYCGQDTFTYVICNVSGCDTAIAVITIDCSGCTAPPTANNDSATTTINTDVDVTILANDLSDCPLDTVYLLTSPLNGAVILTVDINGDTIISYMPGLDFCGLDSFQYVICNPLGCDTAWVFIDISCCITAPIAINDNATTAIATAVNIFVLANDTLGCPLQSITLISTPTGGTVMPTDSNTYVYTPALTFCGLDSFQYAVCNAIGCDTAWVFISISCDTLPPIAVTDFDTTTAGETLVIDMLQNDTLNGNLVSVNILTQPSNGVAIIQTGNGAILYTPNNGFCGLDSLLYQICNPVGCDTAWIYITVPCQEFEIFTGFSPNGDGTNDTFVINGIQDLPGNRLAIYNRWGNRVYFKEEYLNDWAGDWEGKSLPDGTYFYCLYDGKGTTYTGYLFIMR